MALRARFIPKNPGKCEICGEECKALASHLWNVHRKTSKFYYDRILKKEKNFCIYCGDESKFDSLSNGYKKTCRNKECEKKLRSDSAIESKRKLKNDEQKYSTFRERTANAVSKIWSSRSEQENLQIREKIRVSQTQTIQKMSDEERSTKFGWMNNSNVTAEEKRSVWEKSLGKYYKSLTSQQLQEHYDKCFSNHNKFIPMHSDTICITEAVINNLCFEFNLESGIK